MMHWHFTDFAQPTKQRPFWDGFWSAFRHPVLIYGYGFATGFVVRGLVA